jgi:pseudouridine-5'-phosphate glycosidase/pseudouridine kinase
MAECASRLMGAEQVMLVAAVGADAEHGVDAFGAILQREMQASGMRTDALLVKKDSRTAVCNLILGEQGGLIAGVADMDVAESMSTEDVSA